MKSFTKILEGVVRYSMAEKRHTLFQLKKFVADPAPLSLVFSCMDCRVFPSKFTSSEPGENFIVRNAGNFVPYPEDLENSEPTAAAAALDMTCIRNNMEIVVITGHSDCRAMALLYSLRNDLDLRKGTPLELWVKKHGHRTLEKFRYLKEENQNIGPVPFRHKHRLSEVFIDPEQRFNLLDKMSQVNCIQQLENVEAYPFLKEKLKKNKLHLHALWFDVHSGDVFLLSKRQQRFVEINEESFFSLAEEVKNEEESAV